MISVDVVNPLLKLGVLKTLVDGETEEVDVGVQGELVHGVNPTHVIHHKEENGSTLRAGPVTLKEELTVFRSAK